MSWTNCTDECVRPTPAQCHCPAPECHRTFGGVSLFDKHRHNGACLDPVTLGMTLMESGVWRVPMTEQDKARFATLRGETDD